MQAKSAIMNCEQIVTICSNRQEFLASDQQDQIEMIERRLQDNVGVSIVFDEKGNIIMVAHDDQVRQSFKSIQTIIDGKGRSVIPGLVDAHNHPVWAGDRIDEFDAKLRGASYMDIHRKGGGIEYTVKQTKQASQQELLQTLMDRIELMKSCGTTTLECKTGYGLDYQTERKLLQVIHQASSLTPIHLVTTLLAGHCIPRGLTAQQAVDQVTNMMHQLAKNDAHLRFEFVDVFCEKGVYETHESEQILQSALKIFPHCKLAFHGDELSDQNSGCLASRLGARSVSHLEYVNQTSIKQMANKQIAAIINPTTCYLLRLPKPPVRDMINAAVPVVVATDYNPNAMCYSLPMAMNLAAIHLGMTLNECLVACTLNAAYALDRSKQCGSLEIGKKGDCLLLDNADWRHLIGEFGNTASVIKAVIVDGQIIHSKGELNYLSLD